MAILNLGTAIFAAATRGALALVLSASTTGCNAGYPVASGDEVWIGDLAFRAQSPERDDAITTDREERIRFEVRPGERRDSDVARGKNSERAELSAQEKIFFGQATTAEFSMRIVSMDESPGIQQATLIQLHGPNRPELGEFQELGPPPFAMRVKGDIIEILARSGSEYTGAGPQYRIGKVPIALGKWQNFKIQISLGDEESGAVLVWRNDELVADYEGPVGYDVGRGAHYWKFGIYQYGQRNQPSIVDFDRIDFDERGYALQHVGADTETTE